MLIKIRRQEKVNYPKQIKTKRIQQKPIDFWHDNYNDLKSSVNFAITSLASHMSKSELDILFMMNEIKHNKNYFPTIEQYNAMEREYEERERKLELEKYED